jgi:hypothetical protein
VFGSPGVVFLILSFHFVNKNSCVIYFPLCYFVNTLCTHLLYIRSHFHFSVPLWQKGGVIFDLDRNCIFNRSSDFCPRMAKGGVLVCDWLHFVGQNHFYVMMLFVQGYCFIRSLHFSFVLLRRLCAEFKAVSTIPLQLFGRWELSVQTFLCMEKLQTASACIRPDNSTARPNTVHCPISYGISFQNTDMGRQLQSSGRCVFQYGCAHS